MQLSKQRSDDPFSSMRDRNLNIAKKESMKNNIVLLIILNGTIDSIGQQCEKFTCRRKTARWIINVFMYLLALNSFVLFSLRKPGDKNLKYVN